MQACGCWHGGWQTQPSREAAKLGGSRGRGVATHRAGWAVTAQDGGGRVCGQREAYVSDSEMVTFALGNGPPAPAFGRIKLGRESTDNYLVLTGYSKARGHRKPSLNLVVGLFKR